MRSSYSPNPKKNCFREPSPLSWKVGNPKNSTSTNAGGKQKVYTVSKNKSQKSTKSSIKSKKQSAAAIQNYFDNSKMLLNNSVTYAAKSSSKKPKKRGVVASKASKYAKDDLKAKQGSNSGWEMLANLSSSSRERKYATNNFAKSKKVVAEELLNDIGTDKNVCLVNVKQPFNMYNTTHNFMNKSTNHSFNLSYNLGASLGGQDKKQKKYSSSSNKHQKNAAYNSYTNMSKKKHPRASSNTDTSHMHIAKADEYLSRSSKKKNILFKLASEFSQSPEKHRTKKHGGKEGKKKNKENPSNNLYKAFPGFTGD